ncbi:MAG: prolipoprotein diacylglyceryl transferase [Oscillospiraceae bacterium]
MDLEKIAFPGLWDKVIEMDRTALTIFGLDVYWYGVIIACGFLLALLYAFKRASDVGINIDRMIDVVIVGTIGGIVCARLYYVAFQWDYYSQNLGQIMDTRSGGLAIYGGIIGAFVFGYIAARVRKVKVLPMADLAASGLLIGQAIGRWGNFVNVEAFGSITSKPWGMASTEVMSYLGNNLSSLKAQGVDIVAQLEAIGVNVNFSDPSQWQQITVHPTFFYESMWCLIGFIAIAFYTKHRKFDGEITLLYVMWYGLGRSWIEGLRTDSLLIPGTSLRVSQLLAWLCFVTAITLWVSLRLRKRKNPHLVPELYVNTPESKLAISGELYKKDKTVSKAEDKQSKQASKPKDTVKRN